MDEFCCKGGTTRGPRKGQGGNLIRGNEGPSGQKPGVYLLTVADQLARAGSRALQSLRPDSQHALRRFPANARVGDRYSVAELLDRLRERLVTFGQVAFHHDADE